jgi:DNA-binding sugar fermentation-stimulating protein
MSVTATLVHSILKELFPANPHRRIFEEHYVNYKGTRLFFDFYIKELNVFIEVQGRQHVEFVKHFHGDMRSFRGQKHRDNLKIQYVEENNMGLVRIYDTEKVTKKLVLNKINKAIERDFYE